MWFHPGLDPRVSPTPSRPLADRLHAWCQDSYRAEFLREPGDRVSLSDLSRRARVLARQVEREFGEPWRVDVYGKPWAVDDDGPAIAGRRSRRTRRGRQNR